MLNDPYKPPDANVESSNKSTKKSEPGIILIIFTILIVSVNILFVIAIGMGEAVGRSGDPANTVVYLIGAIFFPYIIVTLSQNDKNPRNRRSKWEIFFVASFVVLLSNFAMLLHVISSGIRS